MERSVLRHLIQLELVNCWEGARDRLGWRRHKYESSGPGPQSPHAARGDGNILSKIAIFSLDAF